MMTTDDVWGCGTCTFLNKPLFLSCEMCGQARPSQRPNPPRRQPSMPPAELEDIGIGDRAPRSVQRHRSTMNITGTLIMTDDPNDYETQDGKKPGEEDEAEQDSATTPTDGSRMRSDDPSVDESLEEDMVARSRDHYSEARHLSRALPPRRHTFDHPYQQAPPSTSKPYSMGHGSNQTLPTASIGSSSNRLQLEDCNSLADDASTISSSGRYSTNSSSRRHTHTALMNSRARSSTPQEIHYHGRSSNGLPVITRESSTRYYNNGAAGPMADTSCGSQFSQGNSSQDGRNSSRRNSLGMASAASMRHLSPQVQSGRNLKRSPSATNVGTNLATTGFSDYLPSLAPPPFPTMDSPGDVDVMAVFTRDAEKASANNRRKDRSKMLDNLSRSGALTSPIGMSNVSNRSLLGAGSAVSLSSSSRRLQPTSQRGLSTRLLGNEIEEETVEHPTMMLDTSALDSPNTRRGRNKEKRRMKGAVRTLMATMRLASVTNN